MVGNVSIVRIKALQVWQILKSNGAGCGVFQGERQLSYGLQQFNLGVGCCSPTLGMENVLGESDPFLARDDK